MTVRINLHLGRFQQQVDRAASTATTRLAGDIRAGFDDPTYAWPGVTKRRSGELAGSPRDVVDLGTLRDSQTAPERVASGHYQLGWTADHAAAVFLGAVYKRRAGTTPARNVPLNVLREFDFAAAFADAWVRP